MPRLVLREGAKVGDIGHAWLVAGFDDHPADMGPEEAMVRAIRVEIRVSIATVRAVATGVTGDMGVATGVGACRKRVGTRPGRGPVAVSDGVRGDRARPVDVWAVAGGTVAGVHTRVRVDGRADSLLGGPADERAVADGTVAVALTRSGAGEAVDEIGTVDGTVAMTEDVGNVGPWRWVAAT